jgi:Ca2+-binding RTX toxin-like protein
MAEIIGNDEDNFLKAIEFNSDDVIRGLGGNDVLDGDFGNDVLDGGSGVDTAFFDALGFGWTINLQTGLAVVNGGTQGRAELISIENVTGSTLRDAILGNAGANVLDGRDGDDTMSGAGGDDLLIGGLGNDTLDGNEGNDTFVGGSGGDVMTGGDGIDTADYSNSNQGVTVNLTDGFGFLGDAGGDRLFGIENLLGSTHGDHLLGNGAANFLAGGAGVDKIEGGAGNDKIEGGADADLLDGGAGIDQLRYAGSSAGVFVSLAGNVALFGDAAGDTIIRFEDLVGSNFDDVLEGSNDRNFLGGLNGADQLLGQGGDDTLFGDAGNDGLDGGDGSDVLVGGAGADVLIGGAGVDAASYANAGSAVTVSLAANSGTGSDAAGDTFSGIENLIGSRFGDTLDGDNGGNVLFGLDGGDTLRGLDGADSLDGGLGGDKLFGGAGNDLLNGGAGADQLVGGTGIDRANYVASGAGVQVFLDGGLGFQGDAQGDTFSGIEEVVGSNFADLLVGDAANNFFGGLNADDFLAGDAGDDTMFGDAGSDQMFGGDGRDVLVGGAGADTLDGGAGIDRVSYHTSGAGVLVVLGSKLGFDGDAQGDTLEGIEEVVGSNFNDTLAGDNANNFLGGLNGADVLSGEGGDDELFGDGGADALDGGAGNDILVGGAGGDKINGGAGIDTASYANAASAIIVNISDDDTFVVSGDAPGDELISIENLTGSRFDDGLVGSNGANKLSGGDGNDLLEGRGGDDLLDGGAGADGLTGGLGNDLYVVDFREDNIIERAGEGTADRVAAAVDFALQSTDDIEILTTTNTTSTAAIDLTGNELRQKITGNAGANVLHDGGSGKADVMTGLGGNDSYRVFNSGDVIVEKAGQGSGDKVIAAVDYKLGAAVQVEIMQTNGSAGTAAIDLTGNEFGQQIIGNAGANRLEGKGGNDTLSGGSGADTFVFASKLGAGNVDRIVDFSVPADRMLLSDAFFTALDTGTLSAAAFRANTTGLAQDASDRIIYERDTGKLFYDADGAGGSAGIHFATLTVGLALTNADFSIA